MSSTKTRTKQIRIANETYDFFFGKPLNRYSESLHHHAESGRLILEGGEIKIPTEYSPEEEECLEDIRFMGALTGMTMGKIVVEVARLMNEGGILFESDGLSGLEPWVEELKEKCRKKGIPVEKVVEMI